MELVDSGLCWALPVTVWWSTSPNRLAQPIRPPVVSMISKSRMPSSHLASGISENPGIWPQLPAISVRKVSLVRVWVEPSALVMETLPRYFGANRCLNAPTK